jgi:hypothetical protein
MLLKSLAVAAEGRILQLLEERCFELCGYFLV